MGNVQYFFRQGVVAKVLNSSEITTDRFGLSTGTITLQYPLGTYTPGVPGGTHPYAGYLNAEKETARNGGGWTIVTISYVGIKGVTTNPIFGVRKTLSQEPIETHPLFTTYAGTPAAPLYGAAFDATTGAFIGFQGPPPGTPEFAFAFKLRGIKSWMMPGCTVTKKYYTSKKPIINDVGQKGTLFPDCPITLTNGGITEWLVDSASIDIRGKVFEVTEARIMSGPKGLSPFYKKG